LKLGFNVMRGFIRLSVAFFCVAGAGTSPSRSENAAEPRLETYIGADYGGRAAALTTSTVWSMFGSINQPGFRIKLDGLASLYGDTNTSVFTGNFTAADLKALGDLMAGYQFNVKNFWIKLYAGAAYEAQARLFWNQGEIVQQKAWGGAAAVQSFWRSGSLWSTANLTWVQPHNTLSYYSSLAYEFYRSNGGLKLSVGLETGASIENTDTFKEGKALNLANEYARGGALFNLGYGRNDFTVSGGLSEVGNETAWRPYATIRYGRQF
jgi:hypothetical protein